MTEAGTTLDRPHFSRAGTVTPSLLLLHGTGGTEHDLIPLVDRVLPGSAVLSPRGTVLEGSMPRFFRRLAEGVFDEDDLRLRTDELAAFVGEAGLQVGIPAGSPVAVGFSNGANIASSLLFRHPQSMAGAVLIAAMVPFADGPGAVDLTGKRVLVVNGTRDPIVPVAQTEELVAQLRAAGAQVSEHRHPGGHGLPASALEPIAAFLRSFTA